MYSVNHLCRPTLCLFLFFLFVLFSTVTDESQMDMGPFVPTQPSRPTNFPTQNVINIDPTLLNQSYPTQCTEWVFFLLLSIASPNNNHFKMSSLQWQQI